MEGERLMIQHAVISSTDQDEFRDTITSAVKQGYKVTGFATCVSMKGNGYLYSALLTKDDNQNGNTQANPKTGPTQPKR